MEDEQGDAATQAFDKLRAEVALMRRAVERLAAERADVPEQPDYSETLGSISNNLLATAQRVDALAKSSAQALTPAHIANQIVSAGSDARRSDQQIIAEARAGLDQAARQLAGYVGSARKSDEQNRWLAGAGAGGVVLGLLLWATLAGPIARAVPESWHWPEERAAQALDMPMWQAGGQLLATADLAAYREIITDEQIARANREVIDGCQKAANKAHDTVRCTVRIKPEERRATR